MTMLVVLVGIDLETYSPEGPPWRLASNDPIVCASLAIYDGDVWVVVSLIGPPRAEAKLIRRLLSLVRAIEGVRLWFYGYGEGKFDANYLMLRAERYGLLREAQEAINRGLNIDVNDLAKEVLGLSQDYRLSMSRCERMLGLTRTMSKRDINGSNFHHYYELWLRNGNLTPMWYNQEDSVMTVRIFQQLKNLTT